ncbi:MlaD family protein [Flexibacterium corallicola]|uniref:MlaD family protein n=1 Tax=Flexibacterium corallicola TaxID=3037259 RepID=UPI00286F5FCF|nr:MlaD family protein [Pseudovibrio sp. M1P-2-3]
METRANNIAIGAFVLAVVAVAFVFVFWLLTGTERTSRKDITIVFPGAVTGLPKGGQVLFNGIKVGEVSDLTFDPQNPKLVVATVRVDAHTPLRRDTKASLGFTGLTGVAYVDLHGGSANSPPLFTAGSKSRPVIYASRSQFEDLLEGAKEILQKTDTTLTAIEKVVTASAPKIEETISNVEKFSEALANNSEGLSQFMSGISQTAKAITGLSGRIGALVQRGEQLLAQVPANKLGQIVDNVDTLTAELAKAAEEAPQIVAAAQETADNLITFSKGLNSSLSEVDRVVGALNPEDISKTVKGAADVAGVLSERKQDISQMLASAANVTKNADTISQELVNNKEAINTIVGNVLSASEGIKTGTDNLNKVIASVDPAKVSTIVTNVDDLSQTFADKGQAISDGIDAAASAAKNINSVSQTVASRNQDIDLFISNATQISTSLNAASADLQVTMQDASDFLDSAEQLINAIDPQKVANVVGAAEKVATTIAGKAPEIGKGLDDAAKAAGNFNQMSANLNAQTANVDEIITQGKAIAKNLNAASVRVNGILDKVDSFTEGESGQGLISEATAAAKAIRITADAFAKRAEPMSENLLKFSQQGSSDFTAAMQQLSRTLVEIQRAVANFDRSPNRVIFGGSDTPVFNGAQRR